MELLKDHEFLDKQYVSHTADGISFALAYFKRSDKTRVLALFKEYRPTAFKCDKCGPVVFETAAAFQPDAVNWIANELDRLTKKYRQDKPILGTSLMRILSVCHCSLFYM